MPTNKHSLSGRLNASKRIVVHVTSRDYSMPLATSHWPQEIKLHPIPYLIQRHDDARHLQNKAPEVRIRECEQPYFNSVQVHAYLAVPGGIYLTMKLEMLPWAAGINIDSH